MKLKPNKILIDTYHKRYWRLFRNAYKQAGAEVVARAEHTDPDRLKGLVKDLIDPKPLNDVLNECWINVGGKAYFDFERQINSSKGVQWDLEVKAVTDKLVKAKVKMTPYAYQRSKKMMGNILTSYEESINTVIDKVIAESMAGGLSIPNTRNLLKEYLQGEELASIENWQAERIARTEVGSAYNSGSWESVNENNEGVLKEWMTSGLPGVRETHQQYEGMGLIGYDEEFAPGLLYPQDPNCDDAGDVINCRCTIGYSTE